MYDKPADATGNVGVLFFIQSEEDYQWVLKKGNTAPYIPAFNVTQFTKKRIITLRDSGRISGALVIFNENEEDRPFSFSPDNACPNNQFGLYINEYKKYSSCPWNPQNPVIDLMFEDLGIPLFLVSDINSIDNLTKCFNDHNIPTTDGEDRDYPLCAMQLYSRMNAVRDTPTCMRRNNLPVIPLSAQYFHCDPLASYNIIASLLPTSAEVEVQNRSLIVVAAKLDSFSLFADRAVGAYSAVTSVILLLSIARSLSRSIKDSDQLNRNVLFTLFDGESWDYIGSSRAAYDLSRGNFQPISAIYPNYKPAQLKLQHISHFIELNQIAPFGPTFAHTDPISTNNPEVKTLVENFLNELETQISVQKSNKSLPPSSLQSFLKEDLGIAGVVLSNYDTEYRNKYYNSFLDVIKDTNVNDTVKVLTDLSRGLSNALLKLLKNTTNADDSSNFISLLVHCFFVQPSCTYFNETLITSEGGKPFHTQTYPSVYTRKSEYTVSPYVAAVHRLLLNYTGTYLTVSRSECLRQQKENSNYSFEWVAININDDKNGRCVRSSTFLTEALSPAFLGDSPDWNSKEYSTWTESVFDGNNYARLFLIPSRAHDIVILLVGIGVLFSSFIVTAIFNFYSSSLLSIPPRILPQTPVNT
ncbi:Nicastrin-like protein [Leptotrombidium deliense]|uniref:Nicastrin n=1 Tax=Leptotrombidium deliense TaxID=299467 RepID=A0A443SIQ4_9ACAR|nr:Nicastrin-like protein [Leptotrombidium deliense]